MSDQIHLSGPEANMSREDFKLELERADSFNAEVVNSLLSKLFVKPDDVRFLHELGDEELVKRNFDFEEAIRTLRIHHARNLQETDKRRAAKGKKHMDEIVRDAKPRSIPLVKQATNDELKLARIIAKKKEITVEDALEFLRAKG